MLTRICLVLFLLTSWKAALGAEHTQDDDTKIKAALAAQSAIMVDVREPDEWNAGHLKGAINVPLSAIKTGKFDALPKGKTLYLHCKSGRRSLIAADLLKDAKFTDVRPLAQGYEDLVKKGY